MAALLFTRTFWVAGQESLVVTHPSEESAKYESIHAWFEQSTWRFHSRSYGMATWNQGSLRDDATWAQGGELGLITAPIGHWRIGLSGFFIFEMASTPLDMEVDGMRNRYEIGQYDVTHRGQTVGLERLEDLYIEGTWKSQWVRFGRQTIETPFLNKQDGRMRPTTEEGFVYRRDLGPWKFEGMAIWAVSPRSTVEWYSLSESVGLYGTGLHPTTGNTHEISIESGSKSIYMIHVDSPTKSHWKFHGYHLWWPGVMQTHRVGIDHEPTSEGVLLGFHYYLQTAMGEGGHIDPLRAYMPVDHTAQVYSGRLGISQVDGKRRTEWTLNGTRITDDGRYLMPREWGRDPFFTFLPRERNEGMADLWAATLKWDYVHGHQEWIVAAGRYVLPSWQDFSRNKYQTPSYNQFYVEWADALTGFWEGVHLRTMVAYKWNDDPTLPDFVKVNTVNMLNASFIVDYHF